MYKFWNFFRNGWKNWDPFTMRCQYRRQQNPKLHHPQNNYHLSVALFACYICICPKNPHAFWDNVCFFFPIETLSVEMSTYEIQIWNLIIFRWRESFEKGHVEVQHFSRSMKLNNVELYQFLRKQGKIRCYKNLKLGMGGAGRGGEGVWESVVSLRPLNSTFSSRFVFFTTVSLTIRWTS